jgi:UDP-N-acetylmuramoyl-tripeptide--D-alanyl-D-alanine ligase
MQRLKGIKDSLILDESYNASPDAVMAALDSLYQMQAPQKIALLGNMNELGDLSKQAHIDVGEYCEAKQLDLVVTLGPDANKYLAPAAEAKGCQVKIFTHPSKAGQFIRDQIKTGATILVKGSQNTVYAEEAIKELLADPGDAKLLVRQSKDWLLKKEASFKNS